MSSLPKNYRADLKYPGYTVMFAPTNCKDCDCAQRLVCCQKRIAANIAKLPEQLGRHQTWRVR